MSTHNNPVVVHSVLPRVTCDDPPSMQGHTALAINEKVVVVGGVLGPESIHQQFPRPFGKYNPLVYCYDNFYLRWILLEARFAYPREGHTFVRYKSEALIYGGYGPGGLCREIVNKGAVNSHGANNNIVIPCGYLNDIVSLDLKLIRFEEVVTHGTSEYRSGHAATVVGCEMYVFGGAGLQVAETESVSNLADGQQKVTITYDLHEYVRGDLVKYDILAKTWYSLVHLEKQQTSRVDLPQPRWGHRMTTYGKELIIFGGRDQKDHFGDLYSFNVTSQKWSQRMPTGARKPNPRCMHQQLMWEQYLFVLGGTGPSVEVEPTLWLLDYESMVWHSLNFPSFSSTPSCGTLVTVCDRARQRRSVDKCHRYVDASNYSAAKFTGGSASFLGLSEAELSKRAELKAKVPALHYRKNPTCETHMFYFGGVIANGVDVAEAVTYQRHQQKEGNKNGSGGYISLAPATGVGAFIVQLMRPSVEDSFRMLSPVSSLKFSSQKKFERNAMKEEEGPMSPTSKASPRVNYERCSELASPKQRESPPPMPIPTKKLTKERMAEITERLTRPVTPQAQLEEGQKESKHANKLTLEEQKLINEKNSSLLRNLSERRRNLLQKHLQPKQKIRSQLTLAEQNQRLHGSPVNHSRAHKQELVNKYLLDGPHVKVSPEKEKTVVEKLHKQAIENHKSAIDRIRQKYETPMPRKVISTEQTKQMLERLYGHA